MRAPVRHPREWSLEDRDDVIAVHAAFSGPQGERALAVLRRDLFDEVDDFATLGDGTKVLLDDGELKVNVGRRDAFRRILGWLEAHAALSQA